MQCHGGVAHLPSLFIEKSVTNIKLRDISLASRQLAHVTTMHTALGPSERASNYTVMGLKEAATVSITFVSKRSISINKSLKRTTIK
jgi:hypothetical protein